MPTNPPTYTLEIDPSVNIDAFLTATDIDWTGDFLDGDPIVLTDCHLPTTENGTLQTVYGREAIWYPTH